MGKAAEKFDTYLLFDPDDIAYEFESDVPFTGTAYEWYEDGCKKAEHQFTDGHETGKWREWYPASTVNEEATPIIGSLRTEGDIVDGALHGECRFYRVDGTLQKIGQFAHGDVDGTVEHFDELGNRVELGIYKKNEIKKTVWFRQDGTREQEQSYADGEIGDVVLFYKEDGTKDYEVHMKAGTDEEHHAVWFDEDGEGFLWEDETIMDKVSRYTTIGTNVIGALLIGMIAYHFVARLLTGNG